MLYLLQLALNLQANPDYNTSDKLSTDLVYGQMRFI